eukprot:g34082.t1
MAKIKKHASFEGASLTICNEVGEDWSADGTGRIAFPLYGKTPYFLLFVENVSGFIRVVAGKEEDDVEGVVNQSPDKEADVWGSLKGRGMP